MNLILGAVVLILAAETTAQWYHFPAEAARGAHDMWRAYTDMKESNWKNGDKYFHARGNYDAANRGPGGKWAAKVISDARERVQQITGQHESVFGQNHASDYHADQFANRWGREGNDPNHFRPKGLPKKY